LCGYRLLRTEGIGAFWLAFVWMTRRRRAMCKGIFLLRREDLAKANGLSARDIEPYLDVAA
jgi:hypothetical protein